MRKPVIISFAAAVLLSGACVSTELPPGLTTEEAAQLGVKEGVAGRAAVRAGNCMPGCPAGCSIRPPGGELWAVEATGSEWPAPAGAETCRHALEAPGAPAFQSTAVEGAIAGRVPLSSTEFALPLRPGRYALLVVDDAGCAVCWGTAWAPDGGPAGCVVSEIAPGEVFLANVMYDVSAS